MKQDGKHKQNRPIDENTKAEDLNQFTNDSSGEFLTTDQGVRVNHTDDSLKAGERGPTVMEDFHFREKMTHFDHERIPERVVHARGSAAHGYFQVYESMAKYTKAKFLQDPGARTPVFVRFSTVVGSRGSADTVRDARGFATKFYTEDGNYDLVGNNIPVFFIQDAIKFPDLVHAIKPEPHNEMPQASAAHDTFWDFISLMPESMNMIMWLLSDRAIPRSFSTMEGFGVHTFRFVNEQGKARFVKFHWKPVKGTHSLVFDEAAKLAGKDPDFLRRDLWEAIEKGEYPEFELGVQIVEEEDEFAFDFDLLDPTKIIPEELVPVQIIGKMVLNRNPDNFFAETEQVAFHPGNVVPGIDFSNDPLLQGRLFSYLDTQLIRLGGPNFAEIPVNRPVAKVHNNQRDGYMRQTINRGRVSYSPNSLDDNTPKTASEQEGGYVHHAERVDGRKVRQRSESFNDHFSQARLFWNSQTDWEKQHMVEGFHFELGKVEVMAVRERMVGLLAQVDYDLAKRVAEGIGVTIPAYEAVPITGPKDNGKRSVERSAALSLTHLQSDSIKGRKVAVLVADGVDAQAVMDLKETLMKEGAMVETIAKFQGAKRGANGGATVQVDKNYTTTGSILYDAVFVPGGREAIDTLKKQGEALHFISEAFKHCKPIAAIGEGVELLQAANLMNIRLADNRSGGRQSDKGVISAGNGTGVNAVAREFIQAIAHHRFWEREIFKDQINA